MPRITDAVYKQVPYSHSAYAHALAEYEHAISCFSLQKLSVIAPDGAGLLKRFDESPLNLPFTSTRSGAIVFVGATVLRASALSY